MNDIFDNIIGYFKIESLDKDGNVLDTFEKKNLIMNTARSNMAKLVAGVSTGSRINKLVLGTSGHKGTNYITPKDAGDGFVAARTELFSEESDGYTYPIVFNAPTIDSGNCVIVSEPDSTLGTSTMTMVRAGTDLTYSYEMPALVGNGTGVVVYTEAAFYTGSGIFNMQTFNGKIKDNSVILRITWKISF